MSGLLGKSNLGGGIGKVFAAIAVTYPVGSICTCVNGAKTLKAKGTGGSYLFLIPSGGEWTVHSTNGEKEASKSVIVEENAGYEVNLAYRRDLYLNGDECSEVTGGWGITGWTKDGSAARIGTGSLQNAAASGVLRSTFASGQWGIGGTIIPVDISDFSVMHIHASAAGSVFTVGVYRQKNIQTNNTFPLKPTNAEAYIEITSVGDHTWLLPSNVDSDVYIGILLENVGTVDISSIYLE